MRAAAQQVVLSALEAADLPVDRVGEHRWMTMLTGEWKRTIPLLIELDERNLKVTSLFSGEVDEGQAAVFELLLQRNQRSGPVHFALDDTGNIVLVGAVPLEVVTAERFDELLGVVLELSDRTFNSVLRTGFAGYLAAEQRWRRGAGLPPNPVGEPDPADGSEPTGGLPAAGPIRGPEA